MAIISNDVTSIISQLQYKDVMSNIYAHNTLEDANNRLTAIEKNLDQQKIIAEVLKKLGPPEFTELKCRECGGTIEQKYEDMIVKCPYCGSVYIIGRKHIYDAETI